MPVNFKEVSEKEVLVEEQHAACYSTIFSNGVAKGATKIILYAEEAQLTVPLDMAIAWIDVLNKCGFPCEYTGKKGMPEYGIDDNKYHIFVVDLANYQYKTHLCSTLMLIRYAFEKGYRGSEYQDGIKAYFEIKKAVKRVSCFRALLMSFTYFTGCNHTCHADYYRRAFLTKKQVFDAFKVRGDIYQRRCGFEDVNNCWEKGERLDFNPTKDYNTLYRIMAKMELGKKVYVVGADKACANWFTGFQLTLNMAEADLVIFTGGEDVHPSLYGEPIHPAAHNNLARDEREKEIYLQAKKLGKQCLGICRGSQFMCVMNGGKLVQHQPGLGYIHEIQTRKYGKLKITSTHHQAAYPFNLKPYQYEVIGWTEGQLPFHEDGNQKELAPPKECEIVYYRASKDLGIQGHPEYLDYQQNHKDDLKKVQQIFTDFIKNKL